MEDFPSVIFEPVILQWAREKAEISIESLAVKLQKIWKDITPDLITNWENGVVAPTPTQVRKLAEIYKRPTAVFLLTTPPEENILPPDRRTLGSKKNNGFSSETLLMIRRARRIQLLAGELEEELNLRKLFKYRKHKISQNPIDLAAELRADLSISIQDQFKFRKYSDFFEYLRKKIESVGVITLRSGAQNTLPLADARALSFTDKQPYVILINNQDTEGAKTFSLLHEFAHVLVQEAGICNNFTSFISSTNKKIDPLEVFCNQFAASFLVPDSDFLVHRALVGKKEILNEEVDFVVSSLTKDFKVSRFVILRKLLVNRFINNEIYKERARKWENEKPPKRKKGGKSIPAKSAILRNGVSFSSLVLEAYKKEKLSHASASEYLGTKTKYLPTIEKFLNVYGR